MKETRATKRLLFFIFVAVVISLGASGCKRKSSPAVPRSQAEASESKQDSAAPAHAARVVNAAWYEVPMLSLAYRRAGPGEYTAAHNHLPIGSHVRVTHLGNKKSVIVRITDRGITDRRIKIDLCKGAAEELGMVAEGIARVRIELLPEENAASAPAVAAQN